MVMSRGAVSLLVVSLIIAGVVGLILIARTPDSDLRAQEDISPRDTSATANCFLLAKDRTNLLDDQASDLCRGTPSATGPVLCYESADDALLLTSGQRLELCRCAESTEPVDCYARLRRESQLADAQIAELCAPASVDQLLPNCRPAADYRSLAR
jgi:hypothetical protein